MKALILNSGTGSRMGVITQIHPKCMTDITATDTILSRQLRQLQAAGVREVVITTGLFAEALEDYTRGLGLALDYTFVHNPRFRETNYIYSIYMAREVLEGDILLMHGDLVFADDVLAESLACPGSSMTVSSTLPLPEKDFKAVIQEGRIRKVGIEFFDDAMAAQPLYHLRAADWRVWLDEIAALCEAGNDRVYAENALNQVSGACEILPLDVQYRLCNEIDTVEDLNIIKERLRQDGE